MPAILEATLTGTSEYANYEGGKMTKCKQEKKQQSATSNNM